MSGRVITVGFGLDRIVIKGATVGARLACDTARFVGVTAVESVIGIGVENELSRVLSLAALS